MRCGKLFSKGVSLRFLVVAVALVAALALSPAAAPLRPSTTSSATAWCAGSETWKAARREPLGTPVKVKAKVIRVYYARYSSGRPTFIDLGARYPSRNRVTLVIWGENRVNFPRAPERMFPRGQAICAQGITDTYGGARQIEVALWDPASRLLSF